MMALVAAGLGVALVPRLGQAAVPPGVVVRPLAGPRPGAPRVRRDARGRRRAGPTVAAVLDALVAAAGQRPPTL